MSALSYTDLENYQAEAAKTSGPIDRLPRAALGFFGEREEYREHKRSGQRRSDAIKELGDRAWYLADLCTELEIHLGAAVYEAEPTKISVIAEVPKKWLRGDDNRDELLGKLPGAIAAAWSELEADAVRHIRHDQDVRALMLEIFRVNIDKLRDRQQRGVIRGSGDDR